MGQKISIRATAARARTMFASGALAAAALVLAGCASAPMSAWDAAAVSTNLNEVNLIADILQPAEREHGGRLGAIASTRFGAVQPTSAGASASGRTLQFVCGNGDRVQLLLDAARQRVQLHRSGWTADLGRANAPGLDYAYSNGVTTVEGKGNEMTIYIAHLAPIWCRGGALTVASAR